MKKIVLILSMFIASVSLVNATNVEPNTKKQDEPIKKEKVEKIIDPAKICRYYAITVANQEAEYASIWWQMIYLDEYRDCMAQIQ